MLLGSVPSTDKAGISNNRGYADCVMDAAADWADGIHPERVTGRSLRALHESPAQTGERALSHRVPEAIDPGC